MLLHFIVFLKLPNLKTSRCMQYFHFVLKTNLCAKKRNITHFVRYFLFLPLIISKHAIEHFHVTSLPPWYVGGQKRYIFYPLGNKMYFHAKLFHCFRFHCFRFHCFRFHCFRFHCFRFHFIVSDFMSFRFPTYTISHSSGQLNHSRSVTRAATRHRISRHHYFPVFPGFFSDVFHPIRTYIPPQF